MSTPRAADLPVGSIVATTYQAWIRSFDGGWLGTNDEHGATDEWVQLAMENGAEVLRVGDGQGTETVEQWAVRWTWPDGATEINECRRQGDLFTAEQVAHRRAAAHTSKGITGEALRRYVHITPDEVVARYEGAEVPQVDAGQETA